MKNRHCRNNFLLTEKIWYMISQNQILVKPVGAVAVLEELAGHEMTAVRQWVLELQGNLGNF